MSIDSTWLGAENREVFAELQLTGEAFVIAWCRKRGEVFIWGRAQSEDKILISGKVLVGEGEDKVFPSTDLRRAK